MTVSIKDLKLLWQNWHNMSCKPANIRKYKANEIIDEEKSVRWNREEIERRNAIYDKEVANLNTKRNIARDDMYNMIYAYIIAETNCKCNENKAKIIWDYVYRENRHDGIDQIFEALEETLEFVNALLN